MDIITAPKSYEIQALVYDPRMTQQQALDYAGVELVGLKDLHDLGAVVFAVPHNQPTGLSAQYFVDTLKLGG